MVDLPKKPRKFPRWVEALMCLVLVALVAWEYLHGAYFWACLFGAGAALMAMDLGGVFGAEGESDGR